jgi:HAD superfamily hydrolase (TIGR01509 family)
VTLFANVDLLCLDAGNTVIFLEHARLARLAEPFGCTANAATLVQAEGRAKVRAELGTLVPATVPCHPSKQVTSWASMVATILVESGTSEDNARSAIVSIWPEHVRRNLWSLVPTGLAQALADFRQTGRKVALVSNSEGMLEGLFRDLGIREHFDVLLDSGILGIEKPDPAIFRKATEDAGIAPSHALHLGDVYATDIVGARASGIRCALIDPYGHYIDRHTDVPRVDSVEAAIRAILA